MWRRLLRRSTEVKGAEGRGKNWARPDRATEVHNFQVIRKRMLGLEEKEMEEQWGEL